MLMLLLLNDREESGGVTGTLNTMMIMAFLAGGECGCGTQKNGCTTDPIFPDSGGS